MLRRPLLLMQMFALIKSLLYHFLKLLHVLLPYFVILPIVIHTFFRFLLLQHYICVLPVVRGSGSLSPSQLFKSLLANKPARRRSRKLIA
jgi:hypothetical protein